MTTENTATETMTPEQTRIAELKAELAREEEKVYEQQREVKRQEEEAKRQQRIAEAKVRNAVEAEKLNGYAMDLAKALAAAGLDGGFDKAKVGEETGELLMPAFKNLAWNLRPCFDRRYTSGGRFRAGSFIGYKIITGNVGELKTFPQKKDGSFSYDKIVEDITNRIRREQYAAEAAKEREARRGSASELAKALGGEVDAYGYDHRGRSVAKSPTIKLSIEQAAKLVALLEGK